MTTDITELAQSLKAAANTTADAIDRLKAFPGDELIDLSQHEGEQVDIDIATLNQWYELSSPDNILALVEALEKANRYIERLREWNAGLAQESCERQQLISELEPIRAAAEKLVRCKGRYHSEQNYRALAALFGVKTPDLPPLVHENVHYADAAEMEIEALRQRIAELEESNAQVIQSRDHYKRMTEEGLKQLAEARTVKLPDLRQIVSGDRYVWSDGVYNYSQDVKVALAAAGIKVEAE
ncbi:Ead domain protein [Klebsiella pneumoniae]|uniref:ead/Ea22-like family protein n=1 Tax=Klebsiella pneumoniae TaxID=573 RepID=UPI0006D9AAD6|nr:ead/Ea22-like family protein [Klebsiella pneumoniae]QBP28371.1 Ead domain protein [Klebsiella phage ST101-KPC2phi6.1]ATO01463.1 Ead domain protein [Klebsiella pneumoniae subsp. pneumoniae]ATO07163.1 Ead domain protein [Klebsiella pneumoniae subsp. pneumoniae]KAB1803846.1 ead/Ea22-like family protein [Klebsiella pneumoniae]MBY8374383.1 ead/Ea22-like family protein [Klebsiella pneumoniae]